MAKQYVVSHSGTNLAFGLTKLERSKLYGARRRIAIDTQDRPCVRAALTPDGATLIVSGMTGDPEFRPREVRGLQDFHDRRVIIVFIEDGRDRRLRWDISAGIDNLLNPAKECVVYYIDR
jgi:hypothetical protein